MISLEGWSSTIELLPPDASSAKPKILKALWFPIAHNIFVAGLAGGGGWIRTSVRVSGQIYSLLPLTTRPPLQSTALDYAIFFRICVLEALTSPNNGGLTALFEPVVDGSKMAAPHEWQGAATCR